MCRKTLPRPGRRRTLTAVCLSLALLLPCAAPAAGCEWDYPIWIPRERDADPLYRFTRGGKAGYADDFAGGLAPVGRWDEESDRGDFHYIDRRGRTAIPGPFRLAGHFFQGLAHVRLKPSKNDGEGVARLAYIDAKGKTVFAYEVESDED